MEKTLNGREYKGTMIRIGATMLLFVVLFNLLSVIAIGIGNLSGRFLTAEAEYIVSSLLGSVAYLASFFIPAGFFYLISKNQRTESVMTRVRLDRKYPLMLIGGIAVIIAAAYLNSLIMSVFNYSEFMKEISSYDPLDTNYKLILSVISVAIVPAFCEEFLFRGTILSNLLPYGKTTAVITSAVLFGLMHQNAGQIFYTIVAGIILGLVYVRTRSIWGGVIIHFFNNLISVLEQLMFDRLDDVLASRICTYFEWALFAAGIVCVTILLCTAKKNKRDFSESGFGVLLEPDENYIEKPLLRGASIRGYFNPTVIVFTCISCAEMVLYILMSLGIVSLAV